MNYIYQKRFVKLLHLYVCLLYNEVFLAWKFGIPGYDLKTPFDPPPPQIDNFQEITH